MNPDSFSIKMPSKEQLEGAHIFLQDEFGDQAVADVLSISDGKAWFCIKLDKINHKVHQQEVPSKMVNMLNELGIPARMGREKVRPTITVHEDETLLPREIRQQENLGHDRETEPLEEEIEEADKADLGKPCLWISAYELATQLPQVNDYTTQRENLTLIPVEVPSKGPMPTNEKWHLEERGEVFPPEMTPEEVRKLMSSEAPHPGTTVRNNGGHTATIHVLPTRTKTP